GSITTGNRLHVPARKSRRGSAALGILGAVRQDRSRNLMRLQRLSVSIFGLIAIVSIMLAAAAVWLFLTNPVTVANAVNEGDVSPLVRNLAEAIVAALRGLLRYL